MKESQKVVKNLTPNHDQDYTKNHLISGGGEIPDPPIREGSGEESDIIPISN